MFLFVILKNLLSGVNTYYLYNRAFPPVMRRNYSIIDLIEFLVIPCVPVSFISMNYSVIFAYGFAVIFNSLYFIFKCGYKDNPLSTVIMMFFIEEVGTLMYYIGLILSSALYGIVGLNSAILSFEVKNFLGIFSYLAIILIFIRFDLLNMEALRKATENKRISAIIFYIFSLLLIFLYYLETFASLEVNFNILRDIVFAVFPCILYGFIILTEEHSKSIEFRSEVNKEQIVKAISRIKLHGTHLHSTFRNKYSDDWIKVSRYLIKINMKCGLAGFKQLIIAVILTKNSTKARVDLNKDIYPEVMKLTGANSMNTVISNISTAIKGVWDIKVNEELIKEYSQKVSPKSGAPSNREFIFYVVEKIRNQENDKYLVNIIKSQKIL